MKKFKGFTLIELLVVIAIIGILATVIIINVTGARAKAQRASVESNMSVVSKIMAACNSFGGTLTATAAASGGTICTTLPSDPTESAAASGTYPALPGGVTFGYTGTGASIGVARYTNAAPPVAIANATLSCTVAGCTKGSAWDTTN